MSKYVYDRPAKMNSWLALDAGVQFDDRRIAILEEVVRVMAEGMKTLPEEHQHFLQDLSGKTNDLDELWKLEQKYFFSRQDDYHKAMADMCELRQQKSILEKRVKELEGILATSSSSSSSSNLDNKHDSNYYSNAPPDSENSKSSCGKSSAGKRASAGANSVEFSPRITEKKIKEVFKFPNYYSRDQMLELIGEQQIKWHRRSIPQLLDYKSANDARLKKAENDLMLILKKVPQWLVIKHTILRLTSYKEAVEHAAQQAAVERATLQARQEQEKRDQRRKLENAKRVHEDLRDSMMRLRKKPAVEPVHVHFNESVDEKYDSDDGFVVPDHDSEPENDEGDEDDVGALSDALTDLDVKAAEVAEGEAAVENLD